MVKEPLSGEARAQSWRVFVLVLLSAAYFFQSSGHNEAGRFDQIRAVVEHGEWWIDRFAGNTGDVVHVEGHTYPNKAPGTTLLALAPWNLSRAILSVLPTDEGKQLILVTYALTVLMSAVPTAFISLMLLRLLRRGGVSSTHALMIAVGYGLGTIAFPFATLFFGHQLAAFFAFAAFYLIWSSEDIEPGFRRTARLAVAGLLLGFLPVIEYPGAIASALIASYAIVLLGRSATPVIVAALIGAVPLPIYNAVAFGNPYSLGYSFYAAQGSTFPAHRIGLMGVSWPRLDVLAEITFRPRRGLFYANPWLAFSILAPLFMGKIAALRREFVLAIVVCLAFLTFNSGFGDSLVYWGGAFSFGPRHLLIALPFMALLVAPALQVARLRPIIGLLLVLTILIVLPATAVDPRLPYDPADPFFDFYFPLYARALFSVYPWGTFLGATIFESSGAFNLGRVLGLPHTLEMVPLCLAWALGAVWLFGRETRFARTTAIGIALLALAIGIVPALGSGAEWRNTEAGLCRAISPSEHWEYLGDYSLQYEPSARPRLDRVGSPAFLPDDLAKIDPAGFPGGSITLSGYYEPPVEGWYIMTLSSIGASALYIDGLNRLRVENVGDAVDSRLTLVFLSKRKHEFVVRHMSDGPGGRLNVTIATRDHAAISLESGLTSDACR